MAIDFPNDPSPGATFTTNSKTWTFTDGKWALNVSVGGVRGPAGVAIQETAPATTDVLWADTSITGTAVIPLGGSTGQVLAKSSATDYDTAWATPVTSGDMALKADLASPTFTGTPTLPTGTIATTQTAGNSSTAVATTAFVGTAVANLVDSAPATLNTLDELAAALGDDVNFATTTATAIGLKAPLASPALTGTPTAPTATTGTNSTQLATTAFANAAGGYVYVSSGSFTGSTTFDVTGFSSNYLFYELKMFIAGTQQVTGQLVSGSTLRNTNYYGSTFYTSWNGANGILDVRGNAANFFVIDTNPAPPSLVNCFISGAGQNDFNITITAFENLNTRTVTGGYSNYAVANSFDKIRFSSPANIAGSWSLMGVRKA